MEPGTNSAQFGCMALREFAADDGRQWHVWDITPEKMHPSTRAEDYLQGVLEGWLVFEAVDGHGKARLYPIPATWTTASEEELRAFLRQADAVREPAERRSGPSRAAPEEVPGGKARTAGRPPDREVGRSGSPSIDVRTFRYPGGRVWTVAERAADGAVRDGALVLRFSSGARSLDLHDFPREWSHYSDDELIDLLCSAFPRPVAAGQGDSQLHRRRGDTARGQGQQP